MKGIVDGVVVFLMGILTHKFTQLYFTVTAIQEHHKREGVRRYGGVLLLVVFHGC